MKYYLIVGEASGDLHASHLMAALKSVDVEARFRFYGGDKMATQGGEMVKHYRELAYMGFIPVLLHLRTILTNMSRAKQDIRQWQPDVVILVDYPGFNLSIAEYVKKELEMPVYYYISPKIWAWKEYRIKNIKRDVDELFSILPFEKEFFEGKHHYPIHYVGNPTADEVRLFRAGYTETKEDFCKRNDIAADKPIVALLAGSRIQEIKDNLPMMLRVAERYGKDYQFVLAGAPAIDDDYYAKFLCNTNVRLVKEQTYPLLSHSVAALVTSGTATLETCLFGVPQVVCYKTPVPRLIRWAFNHILKVKYISLVNLIADSEVVQELFAERFTFDTITAELDNILPGGSGREAMLRGYDIVSERLGKESAPENAARIMHEMLKNKSRDAEKQCTRC